MSAQSQDDAKRTLQTLLRIEELLEQSAKSRDSEKSRILELAGVNAVFCAFIASIDVALLSYLETIIAARDNTQPNTSDIIAMTLWFISIALSINLAHRAYVTQKNGAYVEDVRDALLSKSVFAVFRKPCCKWANPCATHRSKLGIPQDVELDWEKREPMPLGTMYFMPKHMIGDERKLHVETHRLKLRGGAEQSWVTLFVSVWTLLLGVGVVVGANLPKTSAVLFALSAFIAPNLISDSVFPYIAVLIDFVILIGVTVINWFWSLFDFLSRGTGAQYASMPGGGSTSGSV